MCPAVVISVTSCQQLVLHERDHFITVEAANVLLCCDDRAIVMM